MVVVSISIQEEQKMIDKRKYYKGWTIVEPMTKTEYEKLAILAMAAGVKPTKFGDYLQYEDGDTYRRHVCLRKKGTDWVLRNYITYDKDIVEISYEEAIEYFKHKIINNLQI